MSDEFEAKARRLVEAWRKSWPAEGVYDDFATDQKKFRMTYSPAESLARDIAQALRDAQPKYPSDDEMNEAWFEYIREYGERGSSHAWLCCWEWAIEKMKGEK